MEAHTSFVKIPKAERDSIYLLMTGFCGLSGTALIAEKKGDELMTYYSSAYVEDMKKLYISEGEDEFDSLLRKIAPDAQVLTMGEGGIETALWTVAEETYAGFTVDYQAIPIRQETVEVCEFYHLNPYRLESKRCRLIALKNGGSLAAALTAVGTPAAVIGKLNATNDRILLYDNGKKSRCLDRPSGDELRKIGL